MYKTPPRPAGVTRVTDCPSTFQLLLPPPPSSMAGPIGGGGGVHPAGVMEDMSPPPGSDQDYCNDSKRKRKLTSAKRESE